MLVIKLYLTYFQSEELLETTQSKSPPQSISIKIEVKQFLSEPVFHWGNTRLELIAMLKRKSRSEFHDSSVLFQPVFLNLLIISFDHFRRTGLIKSSEFDPQIHFSTILKLYYYKCILYIFSYIWYTLVCVTLDSISRSRPIFQQMQIHFLTILHINFSTMLQQ